MTDHRTAAPPQLGGLRILLVDDHPDARELMSLVLEQAGAQVSTAASAAEAYDALVADRPDLVVSDVGLPGEDGYSFARRVRALGEADGGATPLIALTAYTRKEDRERAKEAGFSAHVSKPVEQAELFAAILAAAPARPT